MPDRCERADLEEREPTFTLAEIAAHRRSEIDEARIVVLGERRSDITGIFTALLGEAPETLVWTFARRVFAVGPSIHHVRPNARSARSSGRSPRAITRSRHPTPA